MDGELAAFYAILFAAGLMTTKRDAVQWLLAGTLTALVGVSAYSLAERFFPNVFGLHPDPAALGRLYGPIGYWNGLGGFAAMGAVLAMATAASRSSQAARVAAGASLAVTTPILYLTFSRGAIIAALAGAAVTLAVSEDKLRLLLTWMVVAPWLIAEIWVVRGNGALHASPVRREALVHSGPRAALWVAAISIGVAGSLIVLDAGRGRANVSPRLRRGFAACGVAGAIIALGAAAAVAGGPGGLGHSAKTDLEARPSVGRSNSARDLNTLSLSDRLAQWSVALRSFESYPLFGTGAGTWEIAWVRRTDYTHFDQRAHSLYLETAGELGVVGAVFLLASLLTPLVALRSAPDRGTAAAAAGVVTVFLTQSAVDWDWQLPALAAPFVLCSVGLAQLQPGPLRISLGGARRWFPAGAVVLLAALTSVALQGNRLIADASQAIAEHRPQAAIASANAASPWMPWSYEPDMIRGEAQLEAGRTSAAAASETLALRYTGDYWRIWLDLARATSGAPETYALGRLRALYPASFTIPWICQSLPHGTCWRENHSMMGNA
jgi:hypothetical protein